jgi:uncharacterized membrane protein
MNDELTRRNASQRRLGKLPALISALLLLAAVFGHWPYGFYTLMRLVVCGCSAYLAVKANSARSVAWTWILGGMAVLFNPVLPIRMHRSDWQILDALAAITFLVFVSVFKRHSYSEP